MWIFYKNLPSGTTIRKINKVTLKGYKSGLSLTSLFKKNIIKRTKIISIRDLNGVSMEYHAIVQVDSSIIADNIIDNLDGKTINSIYLKPHRYYRRYPARDRRHHQSASSKPQERRKDDRRRKNLITRVLEIS
jgi:hypothetical protein